MRQATRDLAVGGVIVNDFPTLRFDNLPYGGVKESGFGREKGEQALDEYLSTKNVMIDFGNEKRDPFAVKI